jgi:outer membrane protein OmpA-like peptidoglycan-associated protein
MFNFNKAEQDDSFWISTADLMACIMTIFVFIAFIYIANYKSNENRAKSDSGYIVDTLARQGIVVNKDDMTIAISAGSDKDSLFNSGSSSLNGTIKKDLDKFLLKFIASIYNDKKTRNAIQEVRIEGYSSSEWENVSEEEAYVKNMKLSQYRTIAVLEYILSKKEFRNNKKLFSWAKEHITANGFAASNLIKKTDTRGNVVEDKNKSRRVMFRIVTRKYK